MTMSRNFKCNTNNLIDIDLKILHCISSTRIVHDKVVFCIGFKLVLYQVDLFKTYKNG